MLTGLYAHTHGQYHNYTDPAYVHEVYLDTLTEMVTRTIILESGMLVLVQLVSMVVKVILIQIMGIRIRVPNIRNI